MIFDLAKIHVGFNLSIKFLQRVCMNYFSFLLLFYFGGLYFDQTWVTAKGTDIK